MARTVSATTNTEIAKPVTLPIYLIELGLSFTVRHSTYGTIQWNSQTWTGIGGPPDGEAVEIQFNDNGTQSGRLLLENLDNAFSSIVLNEDVAGKTCKVWMLYGEGPYAVGDAVQIFDGVCDAVPEIGDFVEILIFSDGFKTQVAPRLVCSAPLCNHVPARGTVITWGAENFRATNRMEDRDADEAGEND